jgi:hypothetical protein
MPVREQFDHAIGGTNTPDVVAVGSIGVEVTVKASGHASQVSIQHVNTARLTWPNPELVPEPCCPAGTESTQVGTHPLDRPQQNEGCMAGPSVVKSALASSEKVASGRDLRRHEVGYQC